MKNLLYILSVITLLASCRPEPLVIELPAHEPKLVLNTQIIPNQIMFVGLTRTMGALSFSEENGDTASNALLDTLLVQNATVVVSYGSNADTLIEVESGLYISLTTPQYTDELYTIHVVDHDRGLECTASSTMLQQVPMDNMTATYSNDADSLLSIQTNFTDIDGDNFYMLNVYKQKDDNDAEAGQDVNNYFANGTNVLLYTQLIDDRLYDSNSIESTIDLIGIEPNDSIAVTLSHISEEYFNYVSLRNKSGNWFSEITQEPINYPTNVVNGYGFFNTHFPDTRFLFVNDL